LPCRCLAIALPLPAVSLAVSSPLLPLPLLLLVYCSLSHFFFLPAAFVAVIIFHGLLCFDTSLVAGGACWLSKDILFVFCSKSIDGEHFYRQRFRISLSHRSYICMYEQDVSSCKSRYNASVTP